MKFYWITTNIRNIKRRIFNEIHKVLNHDEIRKAFKGFTKRERTYHTIPLFHTFLNQIASGYSCTEAISWAIGNDLVPFDTCPKTSAYCNAKARLPEAPINDLALKTGIKVESRAHKRDKVFGREVKVVDATTVQLPDTEANQCEYPQPEGQKPGCGQPVMKVCALMGLGTGAIIDCVIGAYKIHEHVLLGKLWSSLAEGNLLLGDRGFGSYAESALLMGMKIDFVFRQRRKSLDNKKLKKIGKEDWLVTWNSPPKNGKWTDSLLLPEQIEVRAIRFRPEVKGFRSKEIILFTSLTDPKKYPKKKLMELYYRRWELEVRFRDIKTTMGLELLKSKTPSGCRKELWMGLLGYNIVRGIMRDASLRGRLPVARISFKKTLGCIDDFLNSSLAEIDPERAYCKFLDILIKVYVPDRQGRIEPRKTKRRQNKGYPYLTTTRKLARIEALSA